MLGKIKLSAMFLAIIMLGSSMAALAETVTVRQKDKKFDPGEITIKVGDTVSFINDDKGAHNVYSSTPGQEFDLKLQDGGSAIEHKFDKAGKVEIGCLLHPRMKLVINVQ
jgi:plastocyanin